MQFLIHFDSITELPSALPRTKSPRQIPWRWLMASICGHGLILLLLVKFATSPELPPTQNKQVQQSPIMAAQLLTRTPVIPAIISPPVQAIVAPPIKTTVAKTVTKTASPDIEPRKVISLPAESMPALASPPVTKLLQKQEVVPANTIELPQHSFSFSKSKPAILSSAKSRLLSNTTTRAEVQAFFNTLNNTETQVDAQQEAGNFATAQISPELFAGAPVLTPAQQDAKQIFDAKIDVDCSSDVNKVLATISQFTLHAVVCQDKGDIDAFIQQRLAGKDSQERLQGLKPRKQRRD